MFRPDYLNRYSKYGVHTQSEPISNTTENQSSNKENPSQPPVRERKSHFHTSPTRSPVRESSTHSKSSPRSKQVQPGARAIPVLEQPPKGLDSPPTTTPTHSEESVKAFQQQTIPYQTRTGSEGATSEDLSTPDSLTQKPSGITFPITTTPQHEMTVVVILGAHWGDEGKGKLADIRSQEAQLCCRAAGGSNAGHSIKVAEISYSFHLLPSGLMDPRCMNFHWLQCALSHLNLLQRAQGA